ncbi:hypothetical protein [Moheibacter sediminis]|uniref:Uncharacterized protein n=1 Tax=Moheibacter sediminis TaxID=1434700 RepID=A0A1W2BCI6_9FLAO|nr:hypothetical protein [Moheibacter sediminis]SMC70619.1 hypothetical protein SAMN06296427_10662 [Moheibacter sediminis]
MKNLFYLFIILSCIQLSAQVGISSLTNYTPGAGTGLSVDGNVTIRDRIFVGGTDLTLGNPGKNGQVLVSQGTGLPPRWRTLNIPTVEENFFYLIYNNAFTDFTNDNTVNEGITINSTAGNNGPYELGITRASLGTDFTTITGLTKTFEVYSNENQVYITFEAVAHITGGGTDIGADFVCGIFAGGNTTTTRTLRGLRKLTLQQSYGASSNPFITYTQIALADDLGIGLHQVEVACKRTASHGTLPTLTIGRSASTNINEFVAKSSLKVEVYEAPQVFNDIVQ